MTEHKKLVQTPGGLDSLLMEAEGHLLCWNKWWQRLWAWNCWLTGTAVILSGLVPFGLGLLIYMPPEHAQALNIVLIVVSAFGFVAQVWNVTQRNRERAQYLRVVANELESAIASYRSGVVDPEEFVQMYQKALARNAQEPAP